MIRYRNILAQGAALLAGLAWAGAPASAAPGQPVLAITGATIFDATGRAPFEATVIVRDGRIAAIGPRLRVPAGAKVIDAKGLALLPGFFDVHTHWSDTGSPASLPQVASAYVTSGFTTVSDFHQQPEAFAPRRAWLRDVVAPHVNFVARISSPGGHGANWGDVNTTKWVSTPESARREVQALQPYEPDYIKAFTDGWRYNQQPEETSMNIETLTALADEAHRHGKRVLSHTVTVARGKLAALAGVDVIAHSLQDAPLDAETIAAIKRAGTFYAPTLAVYELTAEERTPAKLKDPYTQQRVRKWGFAQANLRSLHAAGVGIVLGTDAGVGGVKHGASSLYEMELMVESGLPPEAALIAATANSARALGLIGDRGTIEIGKRADLVLIAGRPWQAIADVRKIDRVFIDGRLVHGGGVRLPPANQARSLPPAPAEELIDDFERPDGRSALDTLRLADMDTGMERSTVITNTATRPGDAGGMLALAVRMAFKDKPEGGVLVPLRRGSVQPVDARRFAGVRIVLRGEGRYLLVINALSGEWTAEVRGGRDWAEARVPFSRFVATRRGREAPPAWRGDDLLQVGIVAQRESGETAWAEIDNLRFY